MNNKTHSISPKFGQDITTSKRHENEKLTFAEKWRLRGKKILYVDDDPVQNKVYSEKFLSCGCKVDIATNGDEALKKINSNKYDILITHLLMPIMSGIDLIYEVRRRNLLNCNIIVLSNLTNREIVTTALSLGIKEYIFAEESTPNYLVKTILKYI